MKDHSIEIGYISQVWVINQFDKADAHKSNEKCYVNQKVNTHEFIVLVLTCS